MSSRAVALIAAFLVIAGIPKWIAEADCANPRSPTQSDLVNQANAPISSLFQIRLRDTYAPAMRRRIQGRALKKGLSVIAVAIVGAAFAASLSADPRSLCRLGSKRAHPGWCGRMRCSTAYALANPSRERDSVNSFATTGS